jgi:glucosamine kinase
MQSKMIIGIDAGGTSIRFEARDSTGALMEEGKCEAAPDGGPEPLTELLAPLLSLPILSIVAGITKVSRTGVVARWEGHLRQQFPAATHLQVLPDYAIALAGALPEGERAGVVVVAGTGSVVYGDNGLGQTLRVGGRGWEFGDEGSGSHLTTEMIRRTIHALDGLQEVTPLSKAVCEELRTDDPSNLGERARQRVLEDGRGFLFPLILTHAQAGDKEAKNLFIGAGGWLAAYTQTCIRRLNLRLPPAKCNICVVTAGGVWEAGGLVKDPFETVLRRKYPNVRCLNPHGTPLSGAVRLAKEATGSHAVK